MIVFASMKNNHRVPILIIFMIIMALTPLSKLEATTFKISKIYSHQNKMIVSICQQEEGNHSKYPDMYHHNPLTKIGKVLVHLVELVIITL